MSTSRPPLIFLVTLPLTGSPSFLERMIASQLMMRSALRLEILTRPVSPSTSSRRTRTSSPILTFSGSSNSLRSRTPSLLRPSSTTKSSPAMEEMRPLRMAPGVKSCTSSPLTSLEMSLAASPRAVATAEFTSSSILPSNRVDQVVIDHRAPVWGIEGIFCNGWWERGLGGGGRADGWLSVGFVGSIVARGRGETGVSFYIWRAAA
jgi:hypothetical protein